jgi:hypothetical protein
VLPKKRINQLKLRFSWNMLDTSVVKQQLFWYAISIAIYGWFMFWIACDIFVWHKPLLQGNIINYIGASASIAFIWVEARLLKSKRAKKKLNPPEQPKPQKPQEKQTEPPKPQYNVTQPASPSPPPPKQTHTNKTKLIHTQHTEHLKNHQNPNPPTTLTQKPQPHINNDTCIHDTGFLKNHQDTTQIPDECLTCTKLIECLANKK